MTECIAVLSGKREGYEYYLIPDVAPVQDWGKVNENAYKVEDIGRLSKSVWGRWARAYKVYWKPTSDLYSTYFVDEKRDYSMTPVQEQLVKMGQFMRDTPKPKARFMTPGPGDWADHVPFLTEPWLYEPKWVEMEGDKPIAVLWYDYLLELADYDDPAMKAHWLAAKDLPIADLLAVSKEHASDYWQGVIRSFEGQYSYMLGGK